MDCWCGDIISGGIIVCDWGCCCAIRARSNVVLEYRSAAARMSVGREDDRVKRAESDRRTTSLCQPCELMLEAARAKREPATLSYICGPMAVVCAMNGDDDDDR